MSEQLHEAVGAHDARLDAIDNELESIKQSLMRLEALANEIAGGKKVALTLAAVVGWILSLLAVWFGTRQS